MSIAETVGIIVKHEQLFYRDIQIAYQIMNEYRKQAPPSNDPEFYLACMYATAYKAGRIDGIRSERQRRK